MIKMRNVYGNWIHASQVQSARDRGTLVSRGEKLHAGRGDLVTLYERSQTRGINWRGLTERWCGASAWTC